MRDPESQAYSAEFLAESFERERTRADRMRRPLSVVFLSIADSGATDGNWNGNRGSRGLTQMVESIRRTLRNSDFVARLSPGRLCVLLPDVDRFGFVLRLSGNGGSQPYLEKINL